MSKKCYLIRDKKFFNELFYKEYDPAFLFNTANLLIFIINHKNKFKEFVKNTTGQSEELDDSYFKPFSAQIHFLELHQLEALFAFLFAPFQSLPHWLYLSTYKTETLKQNIQKYLDNDITSLTSGKCTNCHQFVQMAIYSGAQPTNIPQGKNWETNLGNIDWLLKRLGNKYLKGIEYNSYKHGVRVITGPSSLELSWKEGKEEKKINQKSEDTITFLEIIEKDNQTKTVKKTTKFFNTKDSFANFDIIIKLLTTMKVSRIATFTGKVSGSLTAIYELDKKYFDKLTEIQYWSINV